ncbi:hydrolase 1, exosortase A system-associated [Noviherbaspirillum sp. 17J57-3]|uniref:Hydrolase 1, exosortase A system-associated n=2 Tax=Noviherbaspirillum galbum TaxID=2709383 RepID=A0A6B3SYX9_9BURK|nr:hydrolase 1, exosortase A system-associated [Noviherbaspirillum galbum]
MAHPSDSLAVEACEERATAFQCHDAWLYGILSVPSQPAQSSSRGVLVVVGGPQYRAGSHRQFRLLARGLAAQGIPAFRFDYRGMGDSDGMMRTFESVNDDIRAAIDHFFSQVPELEEVVLWGLCDGASASLFYASQDARVAGLALLNPWVRTEQGEAKAYLKHYYARRLFATELWSKILSGRFDYRSAAHSFWKMATKTLRETSPEAISPNQAAKASDSPAQPLPRHVPSLPERMLLGLKAFRGPVLLVLSGNDLTAQEFSDLAGASKPWQAALADRRVQHRRLDEANHTFAQRNWRDQVLQWTANWVRSW